MSTVICPLLLLLPASPLFSLAPSLKPHRLTLVTVQIYLNPSKRIGSTEAPKSSAATATTVTGRTASATPDTAKGASDKASRTGGRKAPPFSLPLRKCPSQTSYSPLDTPSYRSPIKSPSQYFQICY